jgi:hypothetical protein
VPARLEFDVYEEFKLLNILVYLVDLAAFAFFYITNKNILFS